jgi:hypothetical protein
MPTRKQRRRRAKGFRHEYVWEDEEGNELESDEVRGKGDSRSRGPRRSAPSGREPQAPSWRRTLKRGAVFAPVMFVVVYLLSNDLALSDQLIQTALIVGIFIPFSYLLDGVLWRSYKRRMERQRGQTDGGSGS